MKDKITTFVTNVCDASKDSYVPEADRIATFDMDGTIICEKPLWLEMNVAQTHMCNMVEEDSTLLDSTVFRIAYEHQQNPDDPQVAKEFEDNVHNILTTAFYNYPQERYINHTDSFVTNTYNPDYNIPLKATFYEPMLQLIDYLLDNKFKVFIVSGSEQCLIRGVCKDTVPLNREHMIGSRLGLITEFTNSETLLLRDSMFLTPMNLEDGKVENIYAHIGIKPIFAFGNTDGDFEMLKYAKTNSYPNMAFLLNHNDSEREYSYPNDSTREAWHNMAINNNWNWVSFKDDFNEAFIK